MIAQRSRRIGFVATHVRQLLHECLNIALCDCTTLSQNWLRCHPGRADPPSNNEIHFRRSRAICVFYFVNFGMSRAIRTSSGPQAQIALGPPLEPPGVPREVPWEFWNAPKALICCHPCLDKTLIFATPAWRKHPFWVTPAWTKHSFLQNWFSPFVPYLLY